MTETRASMAEGETYTPRISVTIVPPDPNEAMVEWSRGDKYRYYIKLPRYIANAIIADHTAAAALREALEQVISLGHNNDCMFCGFKDKRAVSALRQPASPEKTQ